MFSTDFIFRRQENLIDNKKFQAGCIKTLIIFTSKYVPDLFLMFQEAPNLPKTRSGKIMRRVLRKIAKDDEDLGDTSTLADPGVVTALQEGHRKLVNK